MAATEKRKIVLVAQHRIPIGKTVIELPAGLVGDTDSHEEVTAAVKRELKEETGYTCQDVEVICSGPLLPGVTDEINSLCWAKGLESQIIADDTGDDEVYEHEIRHGVEGEEIRVYDVPLRTVEEWLDQQIEDNKAVDLKVYLGVLFLKSVFN